MRSIFSPGHHSRLAVVKGTKDFARKSTRKDIVVDLGCGHKPYLKFFKFKKYVGIDILKNSKADIIAPAWDTGLRNNYADLVILNQSLEHIEKIDETAHEMKRILKKGGIALITVPLNMKVHSSPIPINKSPYKEVKLKNTPYFHYDFWRFTPYGLMSLFKDFEIVSLKPSNGYFTTMYQFHNYFFASFGIPYLFAPLYLINNVLAYLTHFCFSILKHIPFGFVKKFFTLIYYSSPLNYILVIKKR